jgi:hypothetical protein
MEYKWSVIKVVVAEDNLVVRVDFTVTATSGNHTASAPYTRNLVRGDSFTPYNQLTEQQVLDWCFKPIVTTWMDADNVEQTSTFLHKDDGEAQVAAQIARQLAQKVTEPALPWANVAHPA